MTDLKDIVSFAKRRGFVYPSSEIYGGFSATYDYGPNGAQLLRNITSSWWKFFIENRDNMVGLDGDIFCHPKTWEASGHVEAFHDPLVEDKTTHKRFRADKLIEEQLKVDTAGMQLEAMQELIKKHHLKSPDGNELTEVKTFNLLVEATLGSTEETKEKVYMRGETCQIIFLQLKNILDTMRVKIPFGVGQIGKSFRNEITTKQFILRTREFQQMETEYFVHPKDGEKAFKLWKDLLLEWFTKHMQLDEARFRFREISGDEKSHYAVMQNDVEYQLSTGEWVELTPLNHRGDWDLSRHSKYSGQDLSYTDPQTQEKFIPNVIETSIGLDRLLYVLIDQGYTQEDKRLVFKLNPRLAPNKVAVFPLLPNKPELVEKAKAVYSMLKPLLAVTWDDRGNIGKRYLTQDEVGTPFCVTVDFDSLKDNAVTVRDRDSMQQERIGIAKLPDYLHNKLA